MSDDKVTRVDAQTPSDEGQKKPEGASEQQPKTWSDDEVRKIIAERDKVKDRLRKIEADEKKAAEDKAIEEGRLKEVLTEKSKQLEALTAQVKVYEEQEERERAEIMETLPDEVRGLGKKLNASELRQLQTQLNRDKGEPHTAKTQTKKSRQDELMRKPGESLNDYMKRVGAL